MEPLGVPCGLQIPLTIMRPIHRAMKISDNRQEYLPAVTLLRTMYNHGRMEAGVYLLGLVLASGDDWRKRTAVVTALYDVQSEGCVKVLFGQLKTVKSTSATRGYLKEVIDVLSSMRPTLVRQGFEEQPISNCSQYRTPSLVRE